MGKIIVSESHVASIDAAVANQHYARNPEYIAALREIQESASCAFCKQELDDAMSKIRIAARVADWSIFPCTWPYQGDDRLPAAKHWVLTSPVHVLSLEDLGDHHLITLLREAIGWVLTEGETSEGFLAMRFGKDTKKSCVTVAHLHAHVIKPRPGNGNSESVSMSEQKYTQIGGWSISSAVGPSRLIGVDGKPAAEHWILTAANHVTSLQTLDFESVSTLASQVFPWLRENGNAGSGGIVVPNLSHASAGKPAPLSVHVIVPNMNDSGQAYHVNFNCTIRGGHTIAFPIG